MPPIYKENEEGGYSLNVSELDYDLMAELYPTSMRIIFFDDPKENDIIDRQILKTITGGDNSYPRAISETVLVQTPINSRRINKVLNF